MSRRAAGFIAALVLIAAAVPVASASVRTAESVHLSPAARTVSACTARSGRLLVDIEIDRSGSLAASDPEDRRVDGVGAALFGLTRLTKKGPRGDAPLRVEVLFSSFAGTVSPARSIHAWHQLDDNTLNGLLDQAEGYGKRDHGRDTDYALALSSARGALNARAAELIGDGGPPPCKVVLFLSDGEFHIGDRIGPTALPKSVPYAPGVNLGRPGSGLRAVAAGRRYLCRPGGLMDRIVEDKIVMFTVALSSTRQFDSADREFLDGLTTGNGAPARCGSLPSNRTGEFVEARNSRDLFFIFSSLAGLTPVEPPCWPGHCPNPAQFTAMPGLSGFLLSASTQLRDVELEVVAPSHERATFANGGETETRLGDASLRQHWIRSRSAEIEASFDPGQQGWQGTWRFRFFTPDAFEAPVPVYALSLQSGLRPRIVGSPKLVPGAVSHLVVQLFDQAGGPVVGGSLAESARLHVEALDGAQTPQRSAVERIGPGRFAVDLKVPDEVPEGDWTIAADVSYLGLEAPVEDGLFSLSTPGPAAAPPGNPWLLLGVGAAVLAALILGAILVSYRRRLAEAGFTPPQILRGFRSEVVTGNGALELDPDPGVAGFGDFVTVRRQGREARERRLKVAPFEFRARVPWRFRGRPVGAVTAAGLQLLGGGPDGPISVSPDRRSGTVALDLAGTWLFAVRSIDDGEVRGGLLVLTDDDAAVGRGEETLQAARAALRAQDWTEFEPPRTEAEESTPGGAGQDQTTDLNDLDDIGWDSI